MVHKRAPQLATFDLARRYRLLDVGNKSGRSFRPASQLPTQDIKQSKRLRCIRIVEALSVKVVGKS